MSNAKGKKAAAEATEPAGDAEGTTARQRLDQKAEKIAKYGEEEERQQKELFEESAKNQPEVAAAARRAFEDKMADLTGSMENLWK